MGEKHGNRHLYDNVPMFPEVTDYTTIESTIVNKKQKVDVPPEFAPVNPIRPKSQCSRSTSNIYSKLSVPYDISHNHILNHKKKKKKKKEIINNDQNLDPTFVLVNPPKERKFWTSSKRKDGQIFKQKLNDLQSISPSNYEEKIHSLKENLKTYQQALTEFTQKSKDEFPERSELLEKIAEFYFTVGNEITSIQTDFESKHSIKSAELKKVEELHKKLDDEQNSLKYDIDRQSKTLEKLRQQALQYQTECLSHEEQLREIQNEKESFEKKSIANRNKLSEIIQQINENEAQLIKVNSELKKHEESIQAKNKEIEELTNKLLETEIKQQSTENVINNYKAIEQDRMNLLGKLKQLPQRRNNINQSIANIQCNRVPNLRNLKDSLKDSENLRNFTSFEQNKKDLEAVRKALNCENSKTLLIPNLSDLRKARSAILKNNSIFDYSIDSIVNAYNGEYDLLHTSEDECRLFSKYLMNRIMYNSIQSHTKNNVEIQTTEFDMLVNSNNNDNNNEENKEIKVLISNIPKSLKYFIRKSRFPKLLTSDYSYREPQSLSWIIHSIRSIFDEKTIDDRSNLREGFDIIPFPEYLLKWAFRQFGRPDLIQKGCWDLFITSHYHMKRFLEIDFFVKFLDEDLTIDQLTFFLNCRAWIMERCVTIPITHKEFNDLYLNEYYLTDNLVREFFLKTFNDLEVELLNDLIIRGCECKDELRVKEKDPANIYMIRILELSVVTKFEENVRRLRKMLALFKPIPKMTFKNFSKFVFEMIINIDNDLIYSLYKSLMTPNKIRVELDQNKFIDMFKSGEKVIPKNFEGNKFGSEEFMKYSNVYAEVLNRCNLFKPFLEKMLNELRKNKSNESSEIVNEIQYAIFRLLDAKFALDGDLLYHCYHRVLQIALKLCLRVRKLDPMIIVPQIEEITKTILQNTIHFDKAGIH